MTTWTRDAVLEVTSGLARIDDMIAAARRLVGLNRMFSAAGACGAGIDAKRDALRHAPPLVDGQGNAVALLELFDLAERLEELLASARAHAMGVTHPDVLPVEELRRRLGEVRGALDALAKRPWPPRCAARLAEARAALDAVLERLSGLDRSDLDRINGIPAALRRFLSCMSDNVDLDRLYVDCRHIDSMLAAAARRLLEPPGPGRKLVDGFLEEAEKSKHELIDYLLAHRLISPEEPGATDLPSLDDHASLPQAVRPSSDLTVELEDADAAIVDWPRVSVIAAPGSPGPLIAIARDTPAMRAPDDEAGPRDEPPPVLYGEEIDVDTCDGSFVRGRAGDCQPAPAPTGLRFACEGEIVGYIWPGSRWRNAVAAAVAEINRAIEWWGQYCIHLKLKQLRISRKMERRMETWYQGWWQNLIREIPPNRLANATIHRRHIDPFREMMTALQRTAHGQGGRLLVVFIDEYITDWSPTLVSANEREYNQIGINWVDSNSPYILAHELIHAFGKVMDNGDEDPPRTAPGRTTWTHDSICHNALSLVDRDPRSPIDLSNRFLDLAEYEEILVNLGAGALTRRPR